MIFVGIGILCSAFGFVSSGVSGMMLAKKGPDRLPAALGAGSLIVSAACFYYAGVQS